MLEDSPASLSQTQHLKKTISKELTLIIQKTIIQTRLGNLIPSQIWLLINQIKIQMPWTWISLIYRILNAISVIKKDTSQGIVDQVRRTLHLTIRKALT